MKIVLDAMGGDHAPQETVKGAIMAARAFNCTIILVGPQEQIAAEMAQHNTKGLDLPIVNAPDVITMGEQATQSVRRKPNSSLVVGLRLLRDGEADAFVSAGHSGACMAAALFTLGRLKGIDRPAVAGFFPTVNSPVLMLDIGVTTDCKPEYLLQFAQMGAAYAERTLSIPNPRVALLSNGEEKSKGDKLVQEAHQLLRQSHLNFVGNAEPKHLMVHSTCDVLVSDGFVGNMVLKMAEAVVAFAKIKITTEIGHHAIRRTLAGLLPLIVLTLLPGKGRWRAPLGALLGVAGMVGSITLPLLRLRRVTDYRAHGGAPLLGVRGVVIIAHGSSDGKAIMNAIRQAKEAVDMGAIKGMVDAINVNSEHTMSA